MPFHIDPDIAWSVWKDMFTEVCNIHAPIMQCKVRGECPWLKEHLKELMRRRDYTKKLLGLVNLRIGKPIKYRGTK